MMKFKFQNINTLTDDVSALFEKVMQSPDLNSSFFSWTSETLKQELSLSKCLCIYIQEHALEASAGFIFYRQNSEFIEIISLATSPDHKRKGVQQAALNEIFKTAESEGLRVLLEVHVENKPAIELYKKNNFKIIHTRRSYYADGADALVMERVF